MIEPHVKIPTSSPPGKLTEERSNTDSSLAFVSTFHRFCCTSVIRPTTTSPISPLYRLFKGLIEINLLTCSLTPATEAFKSSPSVYVPWPLRNQWFFSQHVCKADMKQMAHLMKPAQVGMSSPGVKSFGTSSSDTGGKQMRSQAKRICTSVSTMLFCLC